MKIIKLIKLLLVFSCTFALNSHLYSSMYFPLKVGNKFIFNYDGVFQTGTFGFYENYDYACYITKDTIMNNHKYYRVQNYSNSSSSSYWFRIDSLTGSLYHFDSTNSCPFYFKENLIDSLLMPLYGTSNYCNTISVTSVQNVVKWNKQCVEKQFYRAAPISSYNYIRKYNSFFGPVYRKTYISMGYYAYSSSTYTLKGCMIDSVVYGDTEVVSINKITNLIPEAYSLSQNYPNPFNSTSNLKFEIANLGNVKIVVYDIMGREVETLVNDMLQPGTYETTFDGSMLNSGVYFYRLVTDGFTETKRMLLIK